MDVAISVCLDIALIAVIAVFVAIGVRKGFLRSIIGIVGCIVAVIVAVSFSSGVGEKINDKFVHEPVRKWVVNQLTPDPGNVESSEDEINFDGLFEEQPSFFTDFCGYVNVGVDKLKEIYDNYVAESVESAREHVIDAMATPLASSLSRVIAFAVLFVGTWIVIGLIWLVLSFILHVPVIRKFDKLGVGLDPGISAARQTERPEPSAEPPVSTEKPQPVDAPSEDDVVSAGTLTQDDVWPEQVTWRWPVSGEIERGYSVEALSYDVTMADWRTHDGVDILAQQGEVVVAAGDGEVVSVTQDDLYGTMVVIDHGSGIKTQYSNLADTPTVSPGDKVKGGDVIGSVGKTAICEIGQGSHMQDRKSVV